jgi:hypothetical protein
MESADTDLATASRQGVTRAAVVTAVAVAALHVSLAFVPGRLVLLPGLLSIDFADGLTLLATLLVGPPADSEPGPDLVRFRRVCTRAADSGFGPGT